MTAGDKRLIAAVSIFATLVLGGAVGCGRPRPGPSVGFNDNAVTQGIATPARDAMLISNMGAKIDRVQVDWRSAEPAPGRYDLRIYDAIYRTDLAYGLRPLFIFAYAPPWAAGGCPSSQVPCLRPPAADHIADAARMAALLASRYPRLAGIEIWNEPNTPYFWQPRADVTSYVSLLKACYIAIKRANPAMRVAGGSMSDSPVFNGSQGGYQSLPEFLKGIYREGGGRYMDAISFHPYPDPGDITGTTSIAVIDQVRRIRDANHDGGKPLWVTEVGMSTTGPTPVNPQVQGIALLSLYQAVRRMRAVQMILFHTLLEPPGPASSREPGFGVVRGNGQPKPAYCLLSSALGGSARC